MGYDMALEGASSPTMHHAQKNSQGWASKRGRSPFSISFCVDKQSSTAASNRHHPFRGRLLVFFIFEGEAETGVKPELQHVQLILFVYIQLALFGIDDKQYFPASFVTSSFILHQPWYPTLTVTSRFIAQLTILVSIVMCTLIMSTTLSNWGDPRIVFTIAGCIYPA